ncbi:MAG: hypothetical protein ACOCW3_05110, partial [Spirochaetota bacterium]
MEQLGRVPEGGENVDWRGFRFTVTRDARPGPAATARASRPRRPG